MKISKKTRELLKKLDNLSNLEDMGAQEISQKRTVMRLEKAKAMSKILGENLTKNNDFKLDKYSGDGSLSQTFTLKVEKTLSATFTVEYVPSQNTVDDDFTFSYNVDAAKYDDKKTMLEFCISNTPLDVIYNRVNDTTSLHNVAVIASYQEDQFLLFMEAIKAFDFNVVVDKFKEIQTKHFADQDPYTVGIDAMSKDDLIKQIGDSLLINDIRKEIKGKALKLKPVNTGAVKTHEKYEKLENEWGLLFNFFDPDANGAMPSFAYDMTTRDFSLADGDIVNNLPREDGFYSLVDTMIVKAMGTRQSEVQFTTKFVDDVATLKAYTDGWKSIKTDAVVKVLSKDVHDTNPNVDKKLVHKTIINNDRLMSMLYWNTTELDNFAEMLAQRV